MHTDEQHEPSEHTSEPTERGGVRARLGALLSAAAARLQSALGATSLSPPAGAKSVSGGGRPAGRDAGGSDAPSPDAAAASGAGTEAGELTVSRADGRLRVSDGQEAYVESDTWVAVER